MRAFVIAALIALFGAGAAIADGPYIEQNTSRWGGDYARFETTSNSSMECATACARDGRCQAWTFARPGTEGPNGVCRLKETVPFAAANNCCESGVAVGTGEETRPAHVRQTSEYGDIVAGGWE